MKIALGNDHAALDLKNAVKKHLLEAGYEVLDMGTNTPERVDYPVFSNAVCEKVLDGEADFGIVMCGTGLGMSYAANRHKGIRCALCTDTYTARMSRDHNNANVLAMGQRVLGEGLALEIVDTFLRSGFCGEERHARRIRMLDGE